MKKKIKQFVMVVLIVLATALATTAVTAKTSAQLVFLHKGESALVYCDTNGWVHSWYITQDNAVGVFCREP